MSRGTPRSREPLVLDRQRSYPQAINKWIGGGSKLNLDRTSDADVLKAIIIKLQRRVKAGAATLLIKVKANRGDPLNEEADFRAEMGRLKEDTEKPVTWSTPTNRTTTNGRRLQDQGGYPHHQNISVDPRGPESDATESRGNLDTTPSAKRDKTYWMTQTGGVTGHPSSKNVTNPAKGREFMWMARLDITKEGQSRQPIQRTGSSGSESARETGGMVEENIGKIPGQKENVTSNYT